MWDFPEEAFTTLQAGESFASVVNIAALHAVGGGDYTVSTKGAIPYAVIGTTELAGSVLYESNVLELTLSEEDTSVVERAVPLDILEKRTRLSRCSGNNDAEHRASLQNVVSLASQAAGAARSGSAARFQTWFKTTDQTTRNTVAARFEAVSREASTTTSGATTYACVDPYGYCSPNVLAYALPSQNFISNCPIYYDLPLLSRNCGQQDQTTTALHEFTHTPGVFAPGTQDNAYGTRASQALSAGQALNNADTFALFANCMYPLISRIFHC